MKACFSKCLYEAFPSKIMRLVGKKWCFFAEKSIFFQGLAHGWRILSPAIKNSAFIAWFRVKKTRWEDFFSDSLLMNSFKTLIFSLVASFYNLVSRAFRDSFFRGLVENIIEDWKKRSIRHFAWFMFGFLSIYGIFHLIWGRGFNREEMTLTFLALVFLWMLSHLSLPSQWFSKTSKFLEYLRGLVS